MSIRLKAYWALFVLTLGIYLTMILWSLKKITDAAGGLAPFDLRPGGYNADEATTFIAALNPEMIEFYLTVQHRLDTAYPALLAAVLAIPIYHYAPSRRIIIRYTLTALPLLGAIFDYLENATVGAMLEFGPGVAMVNLASRWTVLKSAFTMISVIVLLALLLARFWNNRKSRSSV